MTSINIYIIFMLYAYLKKINKNDNLSTQKPHVPTPSHINTNICII